MNKASPVDGFLEQVVDKGDVDEAKRLSSVVCSAAKGTPVIYVSDAFEAHTGYAPHEAIGRNLSFLQGPKTEPDAVAKFRKLILEETAGVVRITNYRTDGSLFVHECDFRPVRNVHDDVTHFIAIQRLID